ITSQNVSDNINIRGGLCMSQIGNRFEDLSDYEMQYIAGGNGEARLTPTTIIAASASAASSFVTSFVLSAYTKCR
ncbi:lichenicidin A2 family type 2 lantibiotic, partial [Enterococcus avium]|uniref:lichenicidin A2 family type 2 lantibiotic n=3 Tax=Enterococcus avium TaxID=33945 RepID=UPI0022E82CAA